MYLFKSTRHCSVIVTNSSKCNVTLNHDHVTTDIYILFFIFWISSNTPRDNLCSTPSSRKPKHNLLLTGALTAAMNPNSQSGEVISEVGGFPKKKTNHSKNLLPRPFNRLNEASITSERRAQRSHTPPTFPTHLRSTTPPPPPSPLSSAHPPPIQATGAMAV